MKLIKIFVVIITIITALPLLSASHYITGYVNNARDGTNANDRTVVLWKSSAGISDNLTDIIGQNGNSGVKNIYFIDCEMLNSSCNIGDKLLLKVIDNGDSYISETISLNVTGAGYDTMPNITLNSPPNITFLNYPINYANLSSRNITFNCSANDLDGNLANISLYGNFTGMFSLNETTPASGNFTSILFNKNLDEGFYKWNCLVKDNLSLSSFYLENFSFTIDYTPPNVSSIFVNESYVCGAANVRVSCNVSDNLSGVSKVIIEAKKSSGYQNYSAQLLTGNTYYADILINEDGEWFFNCIANDSSGNYANLSSETIGSNLADLFIDSSEINFSEYNPIEFQNVFINATVYNIGCGNASNFLVGFYKGDPSFGLQIGNNLTVSVNGFSNITINITWNAEIGFNNIFIFVDFNNSLIESNESNNIANKTFNVNAWQIFYGNVGIDKILSNNLLKNMSSWLNVSSVTGNIFITDKEALVDWQNLTAISRDINGNFVDNDFSDIDSLLNMTSFNDSVFNIFSNNGIPKLNYSFLVHQKIIPDVPVINSTNNSNFFTGILWDSSDDNDGEFSIQDKEDLVFVAKVNQGMSGYYRSCDYEANVPVRLRDYNGGDFKEIYFYYELD